MKIKAIFYAVLSIGSLAQAGIIRPIESMRKAIEFNWIAPEGPFRMGEILYFDVVAENIAADSAIVYQLDPATIFGDSLDPYAIIPSGGQYARDTLAPGEKAVYRYVMAEGPRWRYDPFKGVRSFEEPSGLPCLPPGDYELVYRRRWEIGDTLEFSVVDVSNEERPLLDSLAEQFTAFLSDRPDDVIRIADWLYKNDPMSPYTVRGILFGRNVAWKESMCADAVRLDSVFWADFGSPELRYRFVPYPGILKSTAGIIQRCMEGEHRNAYISWLDGKFDDARWKEEIKLIRGLFRDD